MKLKKLHRTLLIILAITLSTAIISGIATSAFGSYHFQEYMKNQELSVTSLEMETKDIPKGIESLIIRDVVYHVTVQVSESEKATISYPKKLINVEVREQGVEIIGKNSKRNWFWDWDWAPWFHNGNAGNIVVTLPKSALKLLEIANNVGDVSIKNLSTTTAIFGDGVGNITVDGLEVTEKLTVKGGVGNTYLNTITGSPRVKINMGVGNININEMKATEVEVDGGMGNVDIENLHADTLDFNAGVGNLTLRKSNLKLLKGDRGLGDVKISHDCQIEQNRFSVSYE